MAPNKKPKKLPEDPYTLKKREEDAKSYWGLAYDRHGVFTEATVDVNWDNISEPLSSFGYDMMNGFLSTDSIPTILDGKILWAGDGSESAPSISFTNDTSVGWWLGQSPTSLNASVSGVKKLQILEGEFQLLTRLNFFPTLAHDIGGDGTVPPPDTQLFCPRNIHSGNHYYLYSGSIFWDRIVGLASANRTHTLQDNSGTIYETGGTDVAIADGGTGQSTASAGFQALAPGVPSSNDMLYCTNDGGPWDVLSYGGAGNDGYVLTHTTGGPAWTAGGQSKVIVQDTTITSNTTVLADHPDFKFVNVKPGATYQATLRVMYFDALSTGGGFVIKITDPVSGSPSPNIYTYASVLVGVPAATYHSDFPGGVTDPSITLGTGAVSAVWEIRFAFKVDTPATTNEIKIQWAAVSAPFATISMMRGSSLTYWEATN